MAHKTWQTIKIRFCDHVNQDVTLESEVVFPAEWLPEQPPRVLAHRCSRAIACNLDNRASCMWAGTNPAYDPFNEKN